MLVAVTPSATGRCVRSDCIERFLGLRPCIPFPRTPSRLGPAVLPQFLRELGTTIKFRSVAEVPIRWDATDLDRLKPRAAPPVRNEGPVHPLEEHLWRNIGSRSLERIPDNSSRRSRNSWLS